MKFATFFYPGFYSCPERNLAARCEIDEWELLRRTDSSVFIKTLTAVPSLGYTDCSEPGVLIQEARLAASYGVDAFIFNYYFDGDHEELSKPLDTFASLECDMQFAVNICCHMPKRKLPFSLSDTNIAPLCQLSLDSFEALGDDLSERFFANCRYLRNKSRVVVTFYHVAALILLYGPEGLRDRLERFRKALRKRSLEAHLVGLFSVIGGWRRQACALNSLSFDSFSCYVALPDFESREAVQPFDAAAERSLLGMSAYRTGGQPLVVCTGSGWNATARGAKGYDPTVHGLVFPYFPVVVNDHPAAFEAYLRRAVKLARSSEDFCQDLLFLGPWNEWTEGCYLLPDTRYGVGKLEAVGRVKSEIARAT